jgi:hypothetical protein
MVPDTYPIPDMLDFAARPAGCTHFSKIDLKKGYHQVPMNAADIPKMAIITLFGLFTCMTFGMHNTDNTFQQLVDRTLCGVENASPYLGDILVLGNGEENHHPRMQEMFSPLEVAHPTTKAENCEFGKTSIEFLGRTISTAGIAPPTIVWPPSPPTPAPGPWG